MNWSLCLGKHTSDDQVNARFISIFTSSSASLPLWSQLPLFFKLLVLHGNMTRRRTAAPQRPCVRFSLLTSCTYPVLWVGHFKTQSSLELKQHITGFRECVWRPCLLPCDGFEPYVRPLSSVGGDRSLWRFSGTPESPGQWGIMGRTASSGCRVFHPIVGAWFQCFRSHTARGGNL